MKIRANPWLKKYALFLMFSLIHASGALAANQDWNSVAPGLSYKKIEDPVPFSGGSIHAFQIDLKHYEFEIALTGESDANPVSIPELMQQKNAAIAINGGFFTPEMELLGLRVSKGTELNPIKNTSWWGVFYIKNDKAQIVSWSNYRSHSDTQFAIQAGPRPVVNGQIPKLKPGMAYRTALGIQPSGKVILLVTENLLLSTQELGEIMRRPEDKGGMNCIDALNLDGGRSTQLYTQLPGLSLQLVGLSRVADTVLVVPK